MQGILRASSLIFLHSSVRIIRPGDFSTLSRTILTFIPSPALTTRGEACFMRIQSRIATASRSREIFLVVGNTGLFNSFSRFAANAPLSRLRRFHQFPSANPTLAGAPSQGRGLLSSQFLVGKIESSEFP